MLVIARLVLRYDPQYLLLKTWLELLQTFDDALIRKKKEMSDC